MQHRQDAFCSTIPFDSSGVHVAAVYCADGRFGDQCDDLLHEGLQLPRYDRLVLPGGPACLAGAASFHYEEQALIQHLRLLINAHALEKVILIAHQDCAFYTQRLHISAEQLVVQQREDLLKAGKRITSLFERVAVETYFAWIRPEETVEFEIVS